MTRTLALIALVLAGARAQAQAPATVMRDTAGTRICAGGDVTLGTNLDKAWASSARRVLRDSFALADDPDTLVAPLRPLFANAEIVLVNAEGAIGEGDAPRKCSARSTFCFAFRQPGSAAMALRRLSDSGTVIANLANNHARDAGNDGLDTTVAWLGRANVVTTGVDTLATPIATARGDTIAFIGFYTSKDTPDARDLDAVRRHVQRAVDRWGTVVVTMHLGAEGKAAQRTRPHIERYLRMNRGNPVAFANAALDAGATMVIGHGPHVMRAMAWRDERLVAFSLGNLVTYGPFHLHEPLDRGGVLCATVSRNHVRDATLTPTYQRTAGLVAVDSSARALTLVDSLSRLDFPRTGARVGADGIVRRPAGLDAALTRPRR